jgi:Tfp pilus assembly protein PilF
MVHSEPKAQRLWVDRPWVDLLVGCGGWSAPLLIVSYLLLDDAARRWAGVFYGLALICNYPHYMATVHRAYARRDDRAQYRLFTHYATALLLMVAIAAHVRPMLLPWLFTIYVMWSPWHYTGQNFGLAMMFLRRAGATVSTQERLRLRIAFVASYVMLLGAMNQGASQDLLVLSIGLPRAIAVAIEAVAGAVFLVSGVLALYPIATRMKSGTDDSIGSGAGSRARLVPAVTLYVTQACWFVIPIALTWTQAVPAPQTRYSSGILAVMHSAQYLWITQHYAQRDAARRPAAKGARASWSVWTYWATLVVGGVALFLPGPWLASYVGHFDFTSSMLTVTAIVNIHHFMLDGVVWKLRDPRVAQALVEQAKRDDAEAGATAAVDATASGVATQTLAPARALPARRLALWITRPAAVCVLLALAALDQWRYALAQCDSDRAALETASVLNPYDATVHVKLARAAIQNGDTVSAERALREAIGANPRDLNPYRSLERFLIQSGRYDEAYAQSRLILDHWPDDVETLVNAGVLAYRLHDGKAAESWWTRALTLDTNQRDVHLYLAELIDATGRAADALPHYQRYLELLAQQPPDAPRPDPRQTALVIVKFADALTRTGQQDPARSQYDLATRIAHQAGLADVEALAREHAQRPSP